MSAALDNMLGASLRNAVHGLRDIPLKDDPRCRCAHARTDLCPVDHDRIAESVAADIRKLIRIPAFCVEAYAEITDAECVRHATLNAAGDYIAAGQVYDAAAERVAYIEIDQMQRLSGSAVARDTIAADVLRKYQRLCPAETPDPRPTPNAAGRLSHSEQIA